MLIANRHTADNENLTKPGVLFWFFFVGAFLYAFLLSLELLSVSFGLLAGSIFDLIYKVTANPFSALGVGILATATIQSSTAVTSILVALVGAGSMSIENSLYVVMGANIGTTFTSSLVSISHLTNKKEFRKAFSAGVIHNLFNVFAVLVFLPLEYYFGFISKIASLLTSQSSFLIGDRPGSAGNVINSLVSPVAQRLASTGSSVIFWCAIGLVMLFACIFLFRTFLKVIFIGDAEGYVNRVLFRGVWTTALIGAGITAFIHSSTVTTSLCVPLAATGKATTRKLFPFIIGANVGTTLTALLAASSRNQAALTLAYSHLILNLLPAVVLLAVPPVHNLFVYAASWLARQFVNQRVLVFIYLVAFFFALPLATIYFINR